MFHIDAWRSTPVRAQSLCEGDGECDTDQRLDNCVSWDIYLKLPLLPNVSANGSAAAPLPPPPPARREREQRRQRPLLALH